MIDLLNIQSFKDPRLSRRIALAREREAVRSWTGSNREARKVRFKRRDRNKKT